MGEMADFALDQMMDIDELQCQYESFESAAEAGVEDTLYSYDGSRVGAVFGNFRGARMPKVVKQTGGVKPSVAPKKSGVIGRISDMNFDDDDGISVCLYGASGSGKTTVWGSFPGPILSIICSGGSRPGELRSLLTPEHRKKIKTVTIEKSSDIRELINHQVETEKFKSVVIDHGSGLQDFILKELLGIDELPAQLGWGVASQQTWGQVGLQMKEILRAFLSMPACNRVVICQEREFKSEDNGDEFGIQPAVGPGLTPSVAGWLTPACDYVVQTFKKQRTVTKDVTIGKNTNQVITKVKGVDYCLRTGPDATYMTKFRVPKGTPLPEYIVDPDYDKMMELINGG